MGSFSWLDCTDNSVRIINGFKRNVYALIPEEFGGGHLIEMCYEGYGEFAGEDIYELVADWNRKYFSLRPNVIIPHENKKVCLYPWYPYYCDLSLSTKDIVELMRNNGFSYFQYRSIGIDIACYDKDNAALPYPIKITYNRNAVYENYDSSPADPNQGFSTDEYGMSYDDWDEGDADYISSGIPCNTKCISQTAILNAERILIDNGLDADDASEVLRAIGYVLLDTELYPD